MIKKIRKRYLLYSKKTHRRLGVFKTKKAALKRERQIQYFKYIKKLKGRS